MYLYLHCVIYFNREKVFERELHYKEITIEDLQKQ